ncbi:hypothetical protein BDV28DRAFT_162347 [Aspergillus coremiiformis]|uniref:Nephrocystin 3-like N-terminal domain-containing protein n=1 Tax=Aspergillus coremiiformis TaxID=138285 RepID=A0A5N6Z1P7_9EURO|nr:hypothetical protein BDV28DRAFT_162347 [Aspergillus coremiiformis]
MGMELAFEMIDVIPEEYGLSVIKGVLGIAFETAKKRKENRDKILEAFESIPESILSINLACGLLKPTEDDEKLRQDFHIKLLTSMPELVDILLGKLAWYRRVASYLTFKTDETLKVDGILSDWNRYIANLREHVMRMRDRLWSEIAYHSAGTYQMGVQTNRKLDIFGNQLNEIQSIIVALEPAIVAAMKKGFENGFLELERAIQAKLSGVMAQTLLLHGFQDLESVGNRLGGVDSQDLNDEELDYNSHILVPSPSSSELYIEPRQTEPYAIITQLELLGLLQAAPSSALDDLQFLFQQSNRHSELSLRQVWWLTRREEFVNWYHDPQSSLLIVDGYLDTMPSDRISPMSIFDASFILNLVRNRSRIVLFFFAGLYDSGDVQGDPDISSPCGLIRSLITQLLSHKSLFHPDLSFLSSDWIEACHKHDLKALCELFRRLLLQVPVDMQVFCILDGLVVYEHHHTWGKQIDYVAARFEHLARENTQHVDTPVLKTMFTFANRSLQISDRVLVPRSPNVWKHAPLAAGYVGSMPVML